jgi:formylglycine-generating enzyme required for sulfatase activity
MLRAAVVLAGLWLCAGVAAAQEPKPAEDACRDGVAVDVAAGTKPCIEPGSGESFKDCPECPEMVVVPAGSFVMGSPESEPDRFESEGPQHKVTIAKPFAVGKFAVTFAEWDGCVADGGCGGHEPGDEGWGRGNRPVINVSWDHAQAYVAWIKKKTGKEYRLLSEAEREYVTRAGTTTPFWWGSSIAPEQANYDGHYTYVGGGQKGEYRGKTVPVQSFQPNPWGLYQVHGNVDEWTGDCWNDHYNGAPADGSAWTAGNCSWRVLRGGFYANFPQPLRSAARNADAAINDLNIYGFRVARTLTP